MAAAKRPEQARARELRATGWSLRRIANELGVSSGSVSVWVRDIRRPTTVAPNDQAPSDRALGDTSADNAGVRRCSRCAETKPLTDFNRHPGGRQWWCRECFRDYFRARGDVHRSQVKSAKVMRLASARELILRHLATHPCVDCGETDVVVLEFDHVGAKRYNISTLVAAGPSASRLFAELQQCEVVCVNCHRRRTARRGRWRRAARDWRSAPNRRARHEERNIAIALEALERAGCVDCGEHELAILDFDHLDAKDDSVMRLAAGGCSEFRLRAEMAKCVVRCANCHRRRTARQFGYYRATGP